MHEETLDPHSFESSSYYKFSYDVIAHFEPDGWHKERSAEKYSLEDKFSSSELSLNHLHHVFGRENCSLDQKSNLKWEFSLKSRDRADSTYSTSRGLSGSFKLLQKWSGYAVSVSDDEFVAVIKDKTNPENPDEEVVLPVDELSPSDQRALVPGSEFFWSIGYETNASGSRFRKSEIRLRRLAPFRAEEIEYASQKAKEMESLFSGL